MGRPTGPTDAGQRKIVDPSWITFIGMGAHTGRTVEQIDADMRELRD